MVDEHCFSSDPEFMMWTDDRRIEHFRRMVAHYDFWNVKLFTPQGLHALFRQDFPALHEGTFRG